MYQQTLSTTHLEADTYETYIMMVNLTHCAELQENRRTYIVSKMHCTCNVRILNFCNLSRGVYAYTYMYTYTHVQIQ